MGYLARFFPQERERDGVPIDWPLTDDEAAIAIGDWTASGSLDFLREHPLAPATVKDWTGPFCIRVIAPDGLEVPYLV